MSDMEYSPVSDGSGAAAPSEADEGSAVTPEKKGKTVDAEKVTPTKTRNPKVKVGKDAATVIGGKRHGRRVEKGKKICRSCGRALCNTAFQINQCNCSDCKKALDVISKKAVSQGKKAWFATQKADPKKLRRMLLNYFAAVSEAEASGNKRATWNLAAYIESIEAETRAEMIDRGAVLWKRAAILFWMSVEGGECSKEAAEAKWKDLEDTMDEQMHDQQGPPKAPLRFRIHKEDIVDFASAYKKRKCPGAFIHWDLLQCGGGGCRGSYLGCQSHMSARMPKI